MLACIGFIFTSADHYTGMIILNLWSCQNGCDALSFLFDNINFVLDLVLSYTNKLCVFQWVQIVHLFLFCYKKDDFSF